jgi:protein-S-isoprenylcysteine O-methyltransferase Ste14
MALREQFESSGNWLFRWRSYLPFALAGFLFLVMREYEHAGNSEMSDHLWEAFCVIITFFGFGIRAFTIGHAPKGTSGRNTEKHVADTLNTTGMYSVVRNPLYLGNFFMGLGIALFVHLWWFALIYVLVFWLYYERIIFAEEAYLRNKFGLEYMEWADSTPVFIPKLSKYRKADLPFSLRNVLKREHNSFFTAIAVMFILETIGELFAEGKFDFDLGWLLFLGIGFVVWLSLRTLRKRTTFLDVEGR